VAPTRWPGSINSKPTANPATAWPTVRPVACAAASVTPIAARARVAALRSRRDRRSTATAAPPPAAATTSAGSKVLDNGLPQHGVDRLAEGGDTRHHDDRDQRRENSVFHEVLAFVIPAQTRD